MAILEILHFPDPRLRTRAKPVEQVDDALRILIDNMFETMYDAPGIGLAATQINVHKRLIIIDISEEKDQPLVLINPELLEKDGVEEMDEGCLSVPGIFERVQRADHIKVRALDRQGKEYVLEAEGLLAVGSDIASETSRISAFVRPASSRGLATPSCFSASRPGRKSAASSALAPLSTAARPRLRANSFIRPKSPLLQ